MQRPEAFLDTTAKLLLFFTILWVLLDLFTLFTIRFTGAQAPDPTGGMYWYSLFFRALVNVFGVFLAVALLKRRHWASWGFPLFLALLAVEHFYGMVYSALWSLGKVGPFFPAEDKAMAGIRTWSMAFGELYGALFIASTVWLFRRFRQKPVLKLLKG